MASSSYPKWMQSREGDVGFEPARVSLETSATLKKSRTSEMTPERPKWLPNDWRMEVRIRTSGKTAGMKDRVIKSLCWNCFICFLFFYENLDFYHKRFGKKSLLDLWFHCHARHTTT